MRDILFRGKQLDNGEWLEGDLRQTAYFEGDTAPYIMFRISGSVQSYINYPVDPNTVGQYTGLTDKNGKKIFEGDIVRRNACPMRITWDDFDASFITECFIDDVRCVNTLAGHSKLEVIGNIHDNPELLEVNE